MVDKISDEEKIINIFEGRIYKNGPHEWLYAQEMFHHLGFSFYVWENGDWRALRFNEINELRQREVNLITQLSNTINQLSKKP